MLQGLDPREDELELTAASPATSTFSLCGELHLSQLTRDGLSLYLQTDWRPLVGQTVEVRRHGDHVRSGTVDAVMEDNSILWIAFGGAHHRTMFERAEGFTVWTPSHPLTAVASE
jgi:hypothetical protein